MILRDNKRSYLGENQFLILSYKYQREQTSARGWVILMSSLLMSLFLSLCSVLQTPTNWVVVAITLFMFWLSYAFFAAVINERELWIQNERIKVKEKPFPVYSRNNNIKISEILRAELVIRRSRYGHGYDAGLKLRNGNLVSFVVASNKEEAEYIVSQINHVLGC